MPLNLLKYTILAFSLFAQYSYASYKWVDADDLHLRSDIQLLADVGVIKVPTTTYPLMWSGIMEGINGLNNIDFNDLSALAKEAFYRVQSRYESTHNTKNITSFSIAAASDTPRFQHYGSPNREKAESTLRTQGELDDWFVYNLEATYAYEPQDGENYRLDGTYINVLLGNWILSAGSYGEWYGPGWDTGLIKTTNARPMPSLNISRNNPQAIDFPLLKWLGPWTLTTGISWMDDDQYREVENTLLWSFRTSFKPHPNLEFGIARTAQICGNGKNCGASAWWDMLIGNSNVQPGVEENPANQLASIDIRWGDTLKGIPYGLYWETMGEDDFQIDSFPPFGKKSYLFGADISYLFYGHSIKTFIEYSDTFPRCGNTEIKGNCAYEHSTYKGGYRYNTRSIASTYDNDAYVYALGLIGFAPNGHQWKTNIRHMDLNKDNINRPPPGGNTAAPLAEIVKQFDFTYLFPLFNGKTETGFSYSHSNYLDDISNQDAVNVWAKWTHTF